MNWIDIIFLALLAGFAYMGWRLKGTLLSGALAAACASPVLAFLAAQEWGPFLQSKSGAWLSLSLCYWVFFAIILGLATLLFSLIAAFFDNFLLSWIDGAAGALTALALGLWVFLSIHQGLVKNNDGWRSMAQEKKCRACKEVVPQIQTQTTHLMAWLKKEVSSKLEPPRNARH
jgi:uncharacterized membrane protein required for colicin V production